MPTYPDLSTIPLIAERAAAYPSAGPELKIFSDTLRSQTKALQKSLPSVKITVPDLYVLNEFLIKYGYLVGFTDLTDPCIVGSYPERTLCSTDVNVQNTYVHWWVFHTSYSGL